MVFARFSMVGFMADCAGVGLVGLTSETCANTHLGSSNCATDFFFALPQTVSGISF